jgi:hypothetical protein
MQRLISVMVTLLRSPSKVVFLLVAVRMVFIWNDGLLVPKWGKERIRVWWGIYHRFLIMMKICRFTVEPLRDQWLETNYMADENARKTKTYA